MSKTNRSAIALICALMPALASAEALDVLVAKQREAMSAEIDKKMSDSRGAVAQPAAVLPPAPAKVEKKAEPVDDPQVAGIYGANGRTTVDVTFGDGQSIPLVVGSNRSVRNWTVQKVLPSAVIFRHVKTGETRTRYLGEPTRVAMPLLGQAAQPVTIIPPMTAPNPLPAASPNGVAAPGRVPSK